MPPLRKGMCHPACLTLMHRRGGLWPPPFYSLFSQATTGRPYDPPIPALSQGHLSTPALPLCRVKEGLKRDPPCPVCQLHRAVGAAFGRLLFIPFSARRPQVAPTARASPFGGRRFLPSGGRMSAQLTGEGEACQLFLSVCSDPALSLITRFAGASPAGGSTRSGQSPCPYGRNGMRHFRPW